MREVVVDNGGERVCDNGSSEVAIDNGFVGQGYLVDGPGLGGYQNGRSHFGPAQAFPAWTRDITVDNGVET